MDKLDIIINKSISKAKVSCKDDKKKKSSDGIWDQIYSKNKYNLNKKTVSEWNKRDFFHYIKNLIWERYDGKKRFDIGIVMFYNDFAIIKDKIRKKNVYNVDNVFMKAYIDWFSNNLLDYYISKYDYFTIHWLKYESTINKFFNYIHDDSFSMFEANLIKNNDNKYKPMTKGAKSAIRKKANKDANLTSELMQKNFECGRSTLIVAYGVIIPFIWLVNEKRISTKEVKDFIVQGVIEINNKNQSMIQKVLDLTSAYNPYPKWCETKEILLMLKELENKTGHCFCKLEIRFSKGIKMFEFLRKEK